MPGAGEATAIDNTLAPQPTVAAWNVLMAELPMVKVQPLEKFLTGANQKTLSLVEKTTILGVAMQLLMETHIYPHLPYKEDLHPDVNPVERLNKIMPGLAGLHDLEFHSAILDAFSSVRDLHTAYFLPGDVRGAIAFLPFQVGFYAVQMTDGSTVRRYVVTRVMKTGTPEGFGDFQPGVEILKVDICPPDLAVRQCSALRAGANEAAVVALGTSLLTLRPLSTSGIAAWGKPPFDKPITSTVHYRVPDEDGEEAESTIVLPWGVGTGFDAGAALAGSAFSISQDLWESFQASKVLWCREELECVAGHGTQEGAADGTPETTAVTPSAPAMTTTIAPFETQFTGGVRVPGFVDPATLTSSQKPLAKFGYLRIRRFRSAAFDETAGLLADFRTALEMLDTAAPDGLVLDIRSNTGGDINAAECMLQMLTAKHIQPARFHLANTSSMLGVLRSVRDGTAPKSTIEDLKAWEGDADGIPLPEGPRLTSGQHLTTEDQANATGQIYQGPVVLLTDALTYSAAEIFAGGFQDNGVGKIIGVDPNTGGGGANLWHYDDLVKNLPSLGLPERLSANDANMQIAIRRSSRLHLSPPPESALQFIEDIGVSCDIPHDRTLDDMLSASPDLLKKACEVLAEQLVHRIDSLAVQVAGNTVTVTVTPQNITRLDFYAGTIPRLLSAPVSPNVQQTIAVVFPAASFPSAFDVLEARGFTSADADAAPVTIHKLRLNKPKKANAL